MWSRTLSIRRLTALVAVLAVAGTVLFATPAHADVAGETNRSIAGDSLLCSRPADLDAESRRLCDIAGSPAQSHPIEHYGLDARGSDAKNVIGNVWETVITIIWTGALWALRLMLFLLETALSLDLVHDAMPGIAVSLDKISHEFQPWVAAVLVCLGVWGMVGIYRGGQAGQTLVGTMTAVLLMVSGLVIVHAPQATVGRMSSLLNDASLASLSLVSGKKPDRPMESLASAERNLFEKIAGGPACTLNLGSSDLCNKPVDPKLCAKAPEPPTGAPPYLPGHGPPTNEFARPVAASRCSVQDLLLRTPAGSPERGAIYAVLKGATKPDLSCGGWQAVLIWGCSSEDRPPDDRFFENPGIPFGLFLGRRGKDPQAEFREQAEGAFNAVQPTLKPYVASAKGSVSIQESSKDHVRTRLLAVLLFALALIAVTLLLGHFALRIFMAKARTLLLLLLMPLTLLAPAFGEPGRAVFVQGTVALAKSGLELVSKVTVLIVVIIGADVVLPSLSGDNAGVAAIAWVGYSVGVWVFKDDVDPWQTSDRRNALPGIIGALGALYLGGKLAQATWGGVAKATGLRRLQESRLAHGVAAREFAEEQREAALKAQAAEQVDREFQDQVEGARGTVGEAQGTEEQLADARSKLDANAHRLRTRAQTRVKERDEWKSELRRLDDGIARDEVQLDKAERDLQHWQDKETFAGTDPTLDADRGLRQEQNAREQQQRLAPDVERLKGQIKAKKTRRRRVRRRLKQAEQRLARAQKVAATPDLDPRHQELRRLERGVEARMPPKAARQAAERVLADAERGVGAGPAAVRERAEANRQPRTFGDVHDDVRNDLYVSRRRKKLR
jgi:hypothetical protein